MPITYGLNLAKSWGAQRESGSVLMKAHTTHTEKSDVFVSYQRSDQITALALAKHLDQCGRHVFIDIHDDTLVLGQRDLDSALITAINNASTMLIIVSDETQGSWWVPWEIGVSTPFHKPRAMYKPQTMKQLPAYLAKLQRILDAASANSWVVQNSGGR